LLFPGSARRARRASAEHHQLQHRAHRLDGRLRRRRHAAHATAAPARTRGAGIAPGTTGCRPLRNPSRTVAMDALSDVLGAIRLTGAVFLQMELREQWSYLTAPARAIAGVLMPDAADHVIPYHLLLDGSSLARLLDGDFVQLRAGDLVMFPAGDRHVLATASDISRQITPTEITGESLSLLARNEVVPFRAGSSGHATRIACGYLA